jgi:hypothetical protein
MNSAESVEEKRPHIAVTPGRCGLAAFSVGLK